MNADTVVLMGDPRVAAVPVVDNGEPLVSVAGRVSLSELERDREPFRRMVRRGVLDRILHAQQALPDGYRFSWIEGHRAVEQQARLFDGYRQELLSRDPSLRPEQSHLLASRYISPPAIAPHVAGAAVDLTLCDPDGVELDLGTAVNASPEDSKGACYFAAEVSPSARAHRQILADALNAAGLVNYPTEWWHWSYGDRYWALATGADHARYGPR